MARDRERAALDRKKAAEDRAIAAVDRREAARERAEAVRFRTESADKWALAAIDELTGARIRAIGLDELANELARTRRSKSRFVLAFVDVDGLKEVNDSRGHLAGDELLRLVGVMLRANLRPYDLIVRYGGDEFLCAMPNLEVPRARVRFEQIATALSLADPEHSISFGLADKASPDETLAAVIGRADASMLETRRPGL